MKLVEHGEDFEQARQEARRRGAAEGLHYVPSFHELLVAGAATYGYELLSRVPGIEAVYVPIGLGSGICGMCTARESLGVKTDIIGVVSEHAPAYAQSYLQRRPVECAARTRLADGLACSVADLDALEIIWRHVADVVTVSDDEVAMLFEDTHNAAEGAGAAGVAAIAKHTNRLRGRRVATVLSGGNVDSDVFAGVLHSCR